MTYIDVDPRLISDEFVDELSDLEFREMFSAAFRYARTRDAADEPIAPWLFKYPPRHRINWQGRRLDLWRQDDGLCYLCGEAVSFEDIHIDHVVPLARGGHDVYENLRVTHSACNLRKGAQLLSELDWAV